MLVHWDVNLGLISMRLFFVAMSAALLAGAVAQAQPINGAPSVLTVPTTATSSPGVPPQSEAAQKHDPMICKTQDQIGTRLGAKRVCMTKSQWAQQTYDAQQATSNIQTQPH